MLVHSALSLISLPALIAAAAPPVASSTTLAEAQGEIFKRGATCLNTNKNNGGWKSIPQGDIRGLIEQLERIGDRKFRLTSKASTSGQWWFDYTWNQAKICISNEYYSPVNTHVSMWEIAWVIKYIIGECSTQ